ncbi:MAG TPA: agmatinase family protein [Bdellovibrionota bacterium]
MGTKKDFDPNSAADPDSGIFGLSHSFNDAKLVFLPVPWEATTSYGGGTADGPAAILEASRQVDLFDLEVDRPYEAGMHFLPESKKIRAWNKTAKAAAQKIIKAGGKIGKDKALQKSLALVNELSEKVNEEVRRESARVLDAGKILALVGGDHASPLGALQAMAEKEREFGILHIDAHSDTRLAYEGFTFSHASILRNVMERIPQVKKLVQVGIRDFCEEEWDFIKGSKGRVETFFDLDCQKRKAEGQSWQSMVRGMISKLPQKVWITFDIDGLDPSYCPHTGTPVPGGLSYAEAIILIGEVARSGRTIVGFDLNEVSPGRDDEWDANVGARLLYKLAAWTLQSQKIRGLTGN